MASPDQQPISEEDARRLAHDLVQLFQAPARVFGSHCNDKPITIADIIRLGTMMAGGVNETTQDDLLKRHNQQFLGNIVRLVDSPLEMEAYLSGLILSHHENAGDIHEAIAQVNALTSGPRADFRFMKKAIEEAMPKQPPGRPTGFNVASDRQAFLDLSSDLSRACEPLLTLKEQFPKKTVKELIAFLEPQTLDGSARLRKREEFIAQAMSESHFQNLKEHKAKVRRLADAIAGSELFGWKYTYAIQRGGEFRRQASRSNEEE